MPVNPNVFNPDMDLMHGQAWYNQMIIADPTDPAGRTVYAGGNLSSAMSSDGVRAQYIEPLSTSESPTRH